MCCDAALSFGAVGGCDLGELLSRAWCRGVPPSPKKNKRIGQKKREKNGWKKQDLAKGEEFFSLCFSPGYIGGVLMALGHRWMCSPEGHSQPRGYNLHQALGWVWTAITME